MNFTALPQQPKTDTEVEAAFAHLSATNTSETAQNIAASMGRIYKREREGGLSVLAAYRFVLAAALGMDT